MRRTVVAKPTAAAMRTAVKPTGAKRNAAATPNAGRPNAAATGTSAVRKTSCCATPTPTWHANGSCSSNVTAARSAKPSGSDATRHSSPSPATAPTRAPTGAEGRP